MPPPRTEVRGAVVPAARPPAGTVRPASRPRTPARVPLTVLPPPRLLPTVLPPLRLLPRTEERDGVLTALLRDEDEGELNELLRELDEELRELLKLLDECEEEELWLPPLRLLLTELLWLLPPLRLPPPPPRCANAGVALSARAIITNVIAFEVFMLLLLSVLVSFSAAKVQPFQKGISETFTYFSRLILRCSPE